MFGEKKIKISKDLYEQLKKMATQQGIDDIDLFISSILEKYLKEYHNKDIDSLKIKKKLENLGYF